MTSIRALLIAEAANPEFTSVPLVGWFYATALQKRCDALIVTQIRNRDALLRAGLIEGTHFIAFDSEPLARPMYRASEFIRKTTGLGATLSTASQVIPYRYFEHLVWKNLGQRIGAGEFDVVHRITPLSPAVPSKLASLAAGVGVPFVWGPINGGVKWPAQFRSRLAQEGEWLSYVREGYRLFPGYRSTRKNSAAILVGSKTALSQMPSEYRERCIFMPENGIDRSSIGATRSKTIGKALRIAFVGRLVPLKGVDMLIEAIAPLAKAGKVVVDIFGDGPERGPLQLLVDRYELESTVKFVGWIENRRLRERLCDYDVFAFPSIREFGGGAVLEAMAAGVAPVVIDYGGPGELVTDETGYRVPLGTREEIIFRLKEQITALCQAPEEVRVKGERARERAMNLFDWDVKAAQTLEVYRWVLGGGEKPKFDYM